MAWDNAQHLQADSQEQDLTIMYHPRPPELLMCYISRIHSADHGKGRQKAPGTVRCSLDGVPVSDRPTGIHKEMPMDPDQVLLQGSLPGVLVEPLET